MKRNMLVKQAVAGLVLVTFIGSGPTVLAADQTVNIQVDAINQIATSGAATLHITTAVAGSAPTSVSDAATTYSVTSNEGSKKITAKINSAMPTGVALNLTATATTGGTSTGAKALTDSDQDMVTGVGQVNETKTLSYELTATAAAGKLDATTRTVTFTIVAGS